MNKNEQNTKWPSRCLDLILRSDGANHRFEFDKRRQFFICARNETLPIIAVRIRNEDRSLVEIHGCGAAPNSNRLC